MEKQVRRIRGIVFDLDETLYPQGEFKRSSFRAIGLHLAPHGADPEKVVESLEGIIRRHGPSHPTMFDDMLAEVGLPVSLVPELVEFFRSHRPVLSPFPGVTAMLAKLRESYRLGLLTDGLARVQRAKVEALALAPCFDRVVYSDDEATSKPDPLLFAGFEAAFGLPGDAFLHVADNPAKDFSGARSRGWLTARVLTGEYSAIVPAAGCGADFELSGVVEVADLLNRLSGER